MKPSARTSSARTSKVPSLQVTAVGMLGCLALLLGGACSSPLEHCDPPIAPGSKFRVTVLGETAGSKGCHIVNLRSPFEITAAQEDPGSAGSCFVTPAQGAPDQQGIQVIRCEPSTAEMLGTYCEMRYPSQCEGSISFYFTAAAGSAVDWRANRIEGVYFRIRDYSSGCIPDRSDCLDEYAVVLDRIP